MTMTEPAVESPPVDAPPMPPMPPDGAGTPDAMGDMMGLTLEEAHAEALELIGEQQVTIRVLSKRLRLAMQMLNASQQQAQPAPTPAAPNRQQRRSNGKKGSQPR